MESENAPRRRKLANRIGTIAGIVVGAALAVALIVEGVPPEGGIESTTTVAAHSVKSSCHAKCKRPETTDAETKLTNSPAADAAGQALFERALNNDAGIFLVRLIAALLAGVLAAMAIRHAVFNLLGGTDPGGGRTARTESNQPLTPPGASSPEPENKPAEMEPAVAQAGSEGAGGAHKSRHFEF